jgi:hypothetical protein
MAQGSENLRDMPLPTLLANVRLLDAESEKGNLRPAEQHVLGWMRIDYARMLAAQTDEKNTEAASNLIQADNTAHADTPPLAHQAEVSQAKAHELHQNATDQFDAALLLFKNAAEALAQKAPGEAAEILLDIEVAPLYKALFTGESPEALANAVDTYKRRLAALYLRFRDIERQVKNMPEQRLALDTAALRTAFCLLVVGSSDEANQHLAVTTSTRAGGSRGQMTAVVFPFDFTSDGYDITTPVHVQLSLEDETVDRGFVRIDILKFLQNGQSLPLLAKLAAATRTGKRTSKRSTRNEATDNLAQEIADAIADASD